MNTKPFCRHAAERGEEIVTRDGRKAYFIAYEEGGIEGYRLIVRILGREHASFFYDNGIWMTSGKSENDLFMRVKTRSINGHEYPEPMTEAPTHDSVYYLPAVLTDEMYAGRIWSDEPTDFNNLKRKLCHTTKEAAIAHAKAIILAGGGEV